MLNEKKLREELMCLAGGGVSCSPAEKLKREKFFKKIVEIVKTENDFDKLQQACLEALGVPTWISLPRLEDFYTKLPNQIVRLALDFQAKFEGLSELRKKLRLIKIEERVVEKLCDTIAPYSAAELLLRFSNVNDHEEFLEEPLKTFSTVFIQYKQAKKAAVTEKEECSIELYDVESTSPLTERRFSELEENIFSNDLESVSSLKQEDPFIILSELVTVLNTIPSNQDLSDDEKPRVHHLITTTSSQSSLFSDAIYSDSVSQDYAEGELFSTTSSFSTRV